MSALPAEICGVTRMSLPCLLREVGDFKQNTPEMALAVRAARQVQVHHIDPPGSGKGGCRAGLELFSALSLSLLSRCEAGNGLQ